MIKSLLVTWKDTKSNLYYHVGTLNYDGEKYLFVYTIQSNSHRKVKEALQNGYRPHPAFPDLHKEYISNKLFSAFDRRIPSHDRVDYDEVLKSLGLPKDADRMDILRETRGMISGDHYSFEEPLRLFHDNHFETNFYINGMRHQSLGEDWSTMVKPGDTLNAVPEKNNVADPYAVRIETVSGKCLGYIPGIYAQAVSALINNKMQLQLTVINTQPEKAPQWWVRVSLKGHLNLQTLTNNNRQELEELIQKVA
ncbi:HIRAN domain-containing protein [Caldifermentibacillus hisashii]|uniref:HIRAN domain-containing protein n=1 Tax=Caldifermentibacillus hisashii TaxID=996558 RepID=UPI001C10B4E8|nr:HIRAN domain-containing protein [Caldifermentibacillus hisashii]MBU5343676.1 HIRAN domain-containing protein [Caldifermentibacillus hisashii]